MKIISHRALLEGPNSDLENHPTQITKAISEGFGVEIDLRHDFATNTWWLGHDKPQYNVNWQFIEEYGNNLWIHAKDIHTLRMLIKKDLNAKLAKPVRYVFLNYFFHDNDDCALTSGGWIWTFPGKGPLTDRSIAVMPERVESWQGIDKCYGLCTDYSIQYKEKFKKY